MLRPINYISIGRLIILIAIIFRFVQIAQTFGLAQVGLCKLHDLYIYMCVILRLIMLFDVFV